MPLQRPDVSGDIILILYSGLWVVRWLFAFQKIPSAPDGSPMVSATFLADLLRYLQAELAEFAVARPDMSVVAFKVSQNPAVEGLILAGGSNHRL